MTNVYDFLNFTIIDFETSGLMPATEQIIEASVIRIRDGQPVMKFNSLVELREGKKLDARITEITGHAEGDLIGAFTEEELAYNMWGMIPEDELIIAHNALFDLQFLFELFRREGYMKETADFTNPFIDSLTIARSREPYPHKLTDCCKRNGVLLDDAHSAEADTLALADLIIKYHKDKDISEWVNVAGYRPKYGEPAWYPEHAILKKQGSEVVDHGVHRKPVKTTAITSNRPVSRKQKKVPVPGDSPKELPGSPSSEASEG